MKFVRLINGWILLLNYGQNIGSDICVVLQGYVDILDIKNFHIGSLLIILNVLNSYIMAKVQILKV